MDCACALPVARPSVSANVLAATRTLNFIAPTPSTRKSYRHELALPMLTHNPYQACTERKCRSVACGQHSDYEFLLVRLDQQGRQAGVELLAGCDHAIGSDEHRRHRHASVPHQSHEPATISEAVQQGLRYGIHRALDQNGVVLFLAESR